LNYTRAGALILLAFATYRQLEALYAAMSAYLLKTVTAVPKTQSGERDIFRHAILTL